MVPGWTSRLSTSRRPRPRVPAPRTTSRPPTRPQARTSIGNIRPTFLYLLSQFNATVCPGSPLADGLLLPKVCGLNTGSHLYIEAGAGLGSEASLYAVTTTAASWRIKVTVLAAVLAMVLVSAGEPGPLQLPRAAPWRVPAVPHRAGGPGPLLQLPRRHLQPPGRPVLQGEPAAVGGVVAGDTAALQHCRFASGASRATAASPGTPALTRTPSRSAAPPPTTTRGRGWPPAARTTCSYQVAGDNMDISTI